MTLPNMTPLIGLIIMMMSYWKPQRPITKTLTMMTDGDWDYYYDYEPETEVSNNVDELDGVYEETQCDDICFSLLCFSVV